MITEPTLLILGAGASAPYGYPVAKVLKKYVTDYNCHDATWIQLATKTGISRLNINAFCSELMQSEKDSIDSFLEQKEHYYRFEKIGKIAIASGLIQHETEESFRCDNNSVDDNWYPLLFDYLDISNDDYHLNRVFIITFNYDRSLEHYLFRMLKEKYSYSDQECIDRLEWYPIFHFYGRLGALPWDPRAGSPYRTTRRPYSPLITSTILNQMIGQIKIIREDINTMNYDYQYSQIFTKFHSKRMFFLGFGYNDLNMQRLNIHELENVEKTGSGFEISPERISAIENQWGIHIPNNTMRNSMFFKEYVMQGT